MPPIDSDIREGDNRSLGGRQGAVAAGVVLSELLDELLEAGSHEVVDEADPAGAGGGRGDESAGEGGALEEDLDGGAAGEEAAEVAEVVSAALVSAEVCGAAMEMS